MREDAHVETIGDYRIRIVSDDDPMHPRQDMDNIAKMACWHSWYDLGDKLEFSQPEDLEWRIEKEGFLNLPLYLYDHSGITMNTTGFSCGWDSGQVGIIYISLEDALEHFEIPAINVPPNPGIHPDDYEDLNKTAKKKIDADYKRRAKFLRKLLGKDNITKMISYMEGEVKVYDDFISGNVYGFIVEKREAEKEDEDDEEWEELDSCWGFYGDYDGDVLEEARSIVKHYTEKVSA